jgi:hypothetical protein
MRHFGGAVLGFDFRSGAECPSWLEMLDKLLPRESDHDHRQEVLQEFMGWMLTGTVMAWIRQCELDAGRDDLPPISPTVSVIVSWTPWPTRSRPSSGIERFGAEQAGQTPAATHRLVVRNVRIVR